MASHYSLLLFFGWSTVRMHDHWAPHDRGEASFRICLTPLHLLVQFLNAQCHCACYEPIYDLWYQCAIVWMLVHSHNFVVFIFHVVHASNGVRWPHRHYKCSVAKKYEGALPLVCVAAAGTAGLHGMASKVEWIKKTRGSQGTRVLHMPSAGFSWRLNCSALSCHMHWFRKLARYAWISLDTRIVKGCRCKVLP